MMIPYLLFGALAVGPYSGVDVDHLMDTPILKRQEVSALSAVEIARRAKGARLQGEGDQAAALTEEGFTLDWEADLPAGEVLFQVVASAPGVGSDSLWVSLDGARVADPLTIPRGDFGARSITLVVPEGGRRRLGFSLREGPGAAVRSISVVRVSVKPPLPPLRAELAGGHPRLLLTAADLPKLRERLKDARAARFYKLPAPLTRKPAAYKPGARNGGAFRNLADNALGALLSPDEEQTAAILAWLEVATTYQSVGVDLDAEYFLEGVALTYDWLYDRIPADLRDRVRANLAAKADELYKASLAGRSGGGHHYQQNHYWYSHLALALAAGALYGEDPRAEQWLAWAWDRFERIALTFSPDGSFHEGPGYWNFSMPALYLYTSLYEWCSGRRIPAGDDGFRGQAEFRFHHLYPGLKLSAALEDSPPRLGIPPISCLLWEARRFRDPLPMGMAAHLATGPSSGAYSFLWLDETVPTGDVPKALPLARYYQDVETAFARTSWEDSATAVAFVSRPLGGHRWAELCERYGLGGTGHNHPEQNHFVLFGRGAVLAGDPGYTYDKQTRNHNTVLVDGKGQYADGEMWPSPKPGRAHVTSFTTQGDVTIVTGDATSAYPPEVGLKRFERTLVLAGRDLVVVRDRLAADQPRAFSWLLHHWGEVARAGEKVTITRDQGQFTLAPVRPAGLTVETSTYRPRYVHPTRDLTPPDADVNLVELKSAPAKEATFLVPLLVGDAGSAPPAVQDASTETYDGVRVGDTLVAFRRAAGRMTVTLPWGEKLETDAAVVVARVVDGKRQVVEDGRRRTGDG